MSVALETSVSSTPLPVPAHFAQAEQSFSLKKRHLPFSSFSVSVSPPPSPARLNHSLPPRPSTKGTNPISRVFPQRLSPWRPLSSSLSRSTPPAWLYDPDKQQSFFSQAFTCLGLLGRGSYGEVYQVLSHTDGRQYAIKRSVHRFRGGRERNWSLREASNHERLSPHPHIVDFIAAWEEGDRLYIQTELCCTSLLQHSEDQPSAHGETAAWWYLCDLLAALQHLHSHGLAHLDVKPANVFLTGSGRLKLGDFGLLLELSQQAREREELQEGDPRYMAPELLHGEYGPPADVFSLGVSILELACNMEVPKGGEGWQQLRQGQLPSHFTKELSSDLQTVLKLMMAPEPRERASVSQLLSLPSIRRRRWMRRTSLFLQEVLLTLLFFYQCAVSLGGRFLSFLHWPFPSHCSEPCTPPRNSKDVTLPLTCEDNGVFVLDASTLDSPSFSHRSRLSSGTTSTPLPAPLLHTPSPTHTHTHASKSSRQRDRSGLLGDDKWTSLEPKNLLSLFEETGRPLHGSDANSDEEN